MTVIPKSSIRRSQAKGSQDRVGDRQMPVLARIRARFEKDKRSKG